MRFALLTILSLLLTSEVMAQRPFQLLKAEVSIAGTSNIHDWVSTTERVKVAGTYEWGADQAFDISALRVTIPVATIKSTKGRIMDNKTYDALQMDQHPDIVFVLRDLTESKATSLTVKGTLTIAGTSKTVSLTVDRRVDSKGVLTFSGTKALKMTDFGIDPPTALLGTLKTGDDVTVTFKLRFQVDPEVTGRR
jgi:polyisoprenoid-binding protein YceI